MRWDGSLRPLGLSCDSVRECQREVSPRDSPSPPCLPCMRERAEHCIKCYMGISNKSDCPYYNLCTMYTPLKPLISGKKKTQRSHPVPDFLRILMCLRPGGTGFSNQFSYAFWPGRYRFSYPEWFLTRKFLSRRARAPHPSSGECGAAEGRGGDASAEHPHTERCCVWVRFLIFGGGWRGQISYSGRSFS